jgi:hypothetical protein
VPANVAGAGPAESAGVAPAAATPMDVTSGRSAPAPADHAVEVDEDALVLQPWEVRFAATLRPFISSPRSAKRLTNIYRILKARVPEARLHVFEGSADAPGEFQVPLLLLAVLNCDSNAATAWFRDVMMRLDGPGGIAEALFGASGPGDAGYRAITGKVEKVAAGANFPTDKKLLAEWIPQVRRFSFDPARGQP